MKYIPFFLLPFVIGTPLISYSQTEGIFATLVFVQGEVQTKAKDQPYQKAEKGAIIPMGNLIRTGAHSLCEVEITLVEQNQSGYNQYVFDTIRMYHSSTIKLNTYSLEQGNIAMLAGDILTSIHTSLNPINPFSLTLEGPFFTTKVTAGKNRIAINGTEQTQTIWLLNGNAELMKAEGTPISIGERKKLALKRNDPLKASGIVDAIPEEMFFDENKTIKKTIQITVGSERFTSTYQETVFADGDFNNHFGRIHPKNFEMVYYDHYSIELDGTLIFNNRLNRSSISIKNVEETIVESGRTSPFVCAFFESNGNVDRFYIYSMLGNMEKIFKYNRDINSKLKSITVFNKKEQPQFDLFLDEKQRIVTITYYKEDGTSKNYPTQFKTQRNTSIAENPLFREDGFLVEKPKE